MLQWLHLIGIAMKLGVGLPLLFAPRTLARVLGLPKVDEAFWPRMLGVTLIGLSVATVIEAHVMPGRGLGVAGSVGLDLTVAAGLGGLLILGRAGTTKRGRAVLWMAVAALLLLGLVGIVSVL